MKREQKVEKKGEKPPLYLKPSAYGAALAAGVVVGFGRYLIEGDGIRREQQELAQAKRNNIPNDAAVRSLCNATLQDGMVSDAEVNTLYLVGPTVVGDLEWTALKRVFSETGLPFRAPNVDLSRHDFLGDSVHHLAANNQKVQDVIQTWREARFRVRESNLARSDSRIDGHFMQHVSAQLQIENRLVTLERKEENVPKASFETGAAISGGLLAALVIVRVVIAAKHKIQELRRRRTDAQRTEHTPEPRQPVRQMPAPARPEPKPKAAVPVRSPERVANTGGGKKKEQIENERKELFEDAVDELKEVVGSEARKLLEVLGDKVSRRILTEIVEGNYHSLISLIEKSKKLLELRGENADAIIRKLKGEETPAAAQETHAAVETKRPHHELDDVSRWGWKSNNFRHLLGTYGFDTSEPNGSGHFFVIYNGEKLRGEDNRFILITYKGSGNDVSPGRASRVLRACADFLVRKEQEKADKKSD